MELDFQSGVPIDLKRARFTVRDDQNRNWKLLTTKQAVSRIMKANGVTFYTPYSKKQFQSEVSAYGIDLKTPLDSTQSQRRGFLFFQTPDKRPVVNSQKLTLIIERIPQPVNLALN